MFFLEDAVGVRFHSSADREREKRFGIFRVLCQSGSGESACIRERAAKILHSFGVWFPVNAVKKPLFVQEKIAGEYALPVQFFKKIAGGDSGLRKRFAGMRVGPGMKRCARFAKMLRIQQAEAFAKFGNVGKTGAVCGNVFGARWATTDDGG